LHLLADPAQLGDGLPCLHLGCPVVEVDLVLAVDAGDRPFLGGDQAGVACRDGAFAGALRDSQCS
jgi:hypothetical protein